MGGDTIGATGTTSSAPTSTTLTDSTQTWTTNQWVGHVVTVGSVFGLVVSNTATVLTIDLWHNPTLPIPTVTGGGLAGETAGTTPGSGTYLIQPGNAPAWYIGLSTSATAPSATDTLLGSELWASGGGLNRSRATYSHTTGASSFALSKTYIMNSSDNSGSAATINKIGSFQAQVLATPTSANSGPMMFETAVPNPPVLVSGDQVAITDTISI
jgi:hypothetical protein